MLNKYILVVILAITEREKWALAAFFGFGGDLKSARIPCHQIFSGFNQN
jgi:hypothetical protein